MTRLLAEKQDKSAVNLVDSPIPPDLITAGSPSPRIWIAAQSPDLCVTQGLWDCTAGTYTWEYGWEEFFMVLEGEVSITCDNGQILNLQEGDFAHLPIGLKTEWHVPNYVRKTFVIRSLEPLKF